MKKIGIAAVILVAAALAAFFAGNAALSTGDIINVVTGGGTALQKVIVWQVRFPRVLAASFVGAGLSVSGFLLQNSLNNRLASPGLLGINNGAGLFVLISALVFPFHYGAKCILAFVGALVVTVLVYLLSLGAGMSKTSVILSGAAISSLLVAVIDGIIAFFPETVADKVAFQLGGFSSIPLSAVTISLPVIVLGITAALLSAPALDLLALGDETAGGLGVNVKVYRGLFILLSAVLSGASVSLCGLIGFVGLMVPNLVRILYQGKSRYGVVLTALYGAAFLLLCDTLARLLAFPYELPCGLLLSIIGAPFMIIMLLKKRKRLGLQ